MAAVTKKQKKGASTLKIFFSETAGQIRTKPLQNSPMLIIHEKTYNIYEVSHRTLLPVLKIK